MRYRSAVTVKHHDAHSDVKSTRSAVVELKESSASLFSTKNDKDLHSRVDTQKKNSLYSGLEMAELYGEAGFAFFPKQEKDFQFFSFCRDNSRFLWVCVAVMGMNPEIPEGL